MSETDPQVSPTATEDEETKPADSADQEDSQSEDQVAEPADSSEADLEDSLQKPDRLMMEVDVRDIDTCRKRLKVTISEKDIDAQFEEHYGELQDSASIPGFRPGHAPRKLIERRFRKDARDTVKQKLILKSLEQIDEDLDITPISEPDLNYNAIELPDSGPLTYEFEVEVPPEFDLPEYKGVKVNRPIKEFGEADVDKQMERFLRSYGQLVPKEGSVEKDDFITANVTFKDGDNQVSRAEELSIRVQPVLKFRDGTVEDFHETVVGAKTGDTKTVDVRISDEAPNQELSGKTLRAEFEILDLKTLRLPDLDQDFLDSVGYDSDQQLRDALHSILRRRLEYDQRKSAREQLLEQLLSKTDFELPQALVKRQVQSTFRRQVMDMYEAGYSDEEIRHRMVELQQQSLTSTEQYLREHFLLSKIAEAEELEVTPEDVDAQIEMIAIQNDESPRRVRSRLEKEGSLDLLEVKILEQMAVDRALEYAEYQDVPLEETEELAEEAIDTAATPQDEFEEEEASPSEADETSESESAESPSAS